MPDIGRIALQAARAYDNGDCAEVRRLFDQLLDSGVPEHEAREAFRAEGADPELLPAQKHCYGMLSAVKG